MPLKTNNPGDFLLSTASPSGPFTPSAARRARLEHRNPLLLAPGPGWGQPAPPACPRTRHSGTARGRSRSCAESRAGAFQEGQREAGNTPCWHCAPGHRGRQPGGTAGTQLPAHAQHAAGPWTRWPWLWLCPWITASFRHVSRHKAGSEQGAGTFRHPESIAGRSRLRVLPYSRTPPSCPSACSPSSVPKASQNSDPLPLV